MQKNLGLLILILVRLLKQVILHALRWSTQRHLQSYRSWAFRCKIANVPRKLSRSTKPIRVKEHKKSFGNSIAERPEKFNTREELSHWKIDTLIGEKSNADCVLLTIIECQSRNTIVKYRFFR